MHGPDFDIIVIGGGHAGAEAAWAASNLLRHDFDDSAGTRGHVALITLDADKIGQMSCNPAIGGLAKGQMVREIDALGGLMGLAIDVTGIQFRILNASKGPAVRGPRAQADKYQYALEVQRLLRTRPNLTILEGTVDEILVDMGRAAGVVFTPRSGSGTNTRTGNTRSLRAPGTVLTTGTFMRGLMHTGQTKTPGGRVGEGAAASISANLRALGFELGRLKTGTPPRLAAESIDLDALPIQPGDHDPQPFSEMTLTSGQSAGSHLGEPDRGAYARVARRFPVLEQRCCWVTHTNEAIHEHIRANLDRAPLYNGQIEADCGPRYCPSIEDKVMRFADKTSHHVFLEPESLGTNEIYCNGISTSLPADVQDAMVRRLPGCERAEILRHGYAVEYDMVWPHQIDATGMTKRLSGLFLAGQINGTSGYEEAAGQGLLAGLNAVRHQRGEDLIRLGRDEAYIGVMMDDLVTKTPREPYRMFTSRAEHRLLLRSDNAPMRLTPRARDWGLVDDARWAVYARSDHSRTALTSYLQKHTTGGVRLIDWIKRPEVDHAAILARLNGDVLPAGALDARVIGAVLSEARYAGFIDRHQRQWQRVGKLESRQLPDDMEYAIVTGLRNEARQTLEQFRPSTLGQASRLAGITPADLTVLAMALGKLPTDSPRPPVIATV